MSERRIFHFFAPEGKENRAVELLEQIDCVESIGFQVGTVKKVEFDDFDNPIIVDGFGIVGQTIPTCIDRILTALASEQIAGYSRETQVFFYDPENIVTVKSEDDNDFYLNNSGI